ncbi:MAG TPA: HAMP domain-containing sensor histidine kinase [Chitinophagaceae bacterium]|nr:HAMP domain-containing sensor histidine kinase [Chitinophagaceae bacterium]
MLPQLLNWRTLLAFIAILIVSGTIWYSSYLANKIEKEEKQKVEEWVEASNALLNPNSTDTRLPFKILQGNDDIPIIVTNQNDSILDYKNVDTNKVKADNNYLNKTLIRFKSQNAPIVWIDPLDSAQLNRYYYGHSRLLREVRYYPLVQLLIVGLFIVVTLFALQTNYRSVQNQVWAGMAKETAHQLGTPVSSLEGWLEILRDNEQNEKFIPELEKDVNRLRLVSDRFGKIGSTPQLESRNVVEQVGSVVEYVRKRAPGSIQFNIDAHGALDIQAKISGPLFDWVIENLLKNALDAMEGKGSINVSIVERSNQIVIDVSDTGKGISAQNITRVFKPGFTTKKRGWGLGLSLSKRIIEQYHKGTIQVKHSEPGKGTTFRIVLKK